MAKPRVFDMAHSDAGASSVCSGRLPVSANGCANLGCTRTTVAILLSRTIRVEHSPKGAEVGTAGVAASMVLNYRRRD